MVSAKFYKVVVQSVLLYGSKTWNLTTTALAWFEGFHVRAAYRMAKKTQAQALERTESCVGLPGHRQRAQGVWDALYLILH